MHWTVIIVSFGAKVNQSYGKNKKSVSKSVLDSMLDRAAGLLKWARALHLTPGTARYSKVCIDSIKTKRCLVKCGIVRNRCNVQKSGIVRSDPGNTYNSVLSEFY